MPNSSTIEKGKCQQDWLNNVCEIISQDSDVDNSKMNISWSAYFANQQDKVPKPPAIVTMLPLFRDSAHSPAMVKHGMRVIQQITNHVNPGQIPVMTVDQPLFAIGKKIQWAWPDEFRGKALRVTNRGPSY